MFKENCEWNEWQLGECSVSCGGGTRMDTRTKAKVEAYGGTCEDNGNQREVECNIEECPRKYSTINTFLQLRKLNNFMA